MNLSSNFLEFNFLVTNSQNHIVFEFDEFRLDAAKLMLYRNGQEISLPPKVIETLMVLIENRGEIVSKDELMNKVWSDTIVEESNLSQYLYQLRKVLGLHADGKPFIETFRRRGYRFNGEVQIHSNGFGSVVKDLWSENGNFPNGFLKESDWPAESSPNVPLVEENVTSLPKKSTIGKISALVAMLLVILISAGLYLRYRVVSFADPKANPKKEMTILRLTNGNVPVDATISPDGKYFVYHEFDGSLYRVWVQQIGGTSRIEIVPPTAKAIAGKTFSPDSRYIYYGVQESKNPPSWSLYRVSTLGGAQTRVLNDINSPISFSPDGQEFIFQRWYPQSGESALIIAATDGSNERIFQQRTRGQGILLIPAWSPDGKRIAYCSFQPEDYNLLNIADLQTGRLETLSPEKWDNCYRTVWTHDGEGLIFIGTKYAESLSTRRGQVYYLSATTGESRRLTVDGNWHQILSLGVSDDGAILAVPFNRSSQIWRMSADGDSRTAIQITNGQNDGRAGLVPLIDGRVAYITRTGENLSAWLMNADGSEPRQLISDPPYIEELRAPPDGRYFVFTALHDNLNNLFRIDTDGANLRQLTFANNRVNDATVSPDGNWIVYSAAVFNDSHWNHSLMKIPSSGGQPVKLVDLDCTTPHFSPDGKMLSCIRQEKEILILSAETGAILKTFEVVQNSVLNVGSRWTADGQNVVYIVNRKNIGNLWLQPLNGKLARPLTDFTSGSIYNFAFSPDGTRLYVARGNQINDAILIKNFK